MKEFLKKRYNILIPVFLLIVLLIAVILYGREYKTNRYANVEDTLVYQYFSGIKFEYTASVGRNRKSVILSYEPKDEVINLDSTPIYVKDQDLVIFPKEMMIYFLFNNRGYLVSPLAEVYMENDLYYLNLKNVNKIFEHTFYYDGKDLYFFTDNVTLEVGDKKIELSPMSYVNCSYLNLLEYYDKESDTYGKINLGNERVRVTNEYMTIDVGVDKVVYNDGFALLSSNFGKLPKIADRVDE